MNYTNCVHFSWNITLPNICLTSLFVKTQDIFIVYFETLFAAKAKSLHCKCNWIYSLEIRVRLMMKKEWMNMTFITAIFMMNSITSGKLFNGALWRQKWTLLRHLKTNWKYFVFLSLWNCGEINYFFQFKITHFMLIFISSQPVTF